jgi:hypothetical protein
VPFQYCVRGNDRGEDVGSAAAAIAWPRRSGAQRSVTRIEKLSHSDMDRRRT